ncbi:MAG: phosphate ABC transporter permease subunit PstC [Parvibaculales bacterium]
MTTGLFLLLLATFGGLAFLYGKKSIRSAMAETDVKQHSLDTYHGLYLALFFFFPPFAVILAWQIVSPFVIDGLLTTRIQDLQAVASTGELNVLVAKIKSFSAGALPAAFATPFVEEMGAYLNSLRYYSNSLLFSIAGILSALAFLSARRHIAPRFNARDRVEFLFMLLMIMASVIAIITTIGIVLSLIFETLRFFEKVPVMDFLFGLHWSPQIAIREDQAGGSGSFGAIPLFAGTLMITFIAILVAVPIGLMSAIYLSEYADQRLRDIAKPTIEVLAGIPTVVYGFFAALLVAPFLRDTGSLMGLSLSSESALAAGMVMGIMIIPVISSLSDDVINAVPQTLRDGAYALGATQSETIKQVVLPAALPGIVSAILLAISRAIGETMIVVMAAGVAANLTANPFESVTTVTVQIVTLLVGDQEFDSAKTLAAFALGLVLFFITLGLNILAMSVVRRFREQYE